MSSSPFDPPFKALPDELAVFPLPGALLLPGRQLALNIFEPRYLAMVEDALAGKRLIGMIQPRLDQLPLGGDVGAGPLYRCGCLGRIVEFRETQDRRYLISLNGLCRFDVQAELDPVKGYRRAAVSWADYEADMASPDHPPLELPRTRLLDALRRYLDQQQLDADLAGLEDAEDLQIVDTLVMACPFSTPEKQALLEAPSLQARADTLITILEMTMLQDQDGKVRH